MVLLKTTTKYTIYHALFEKIVRNTVTGGVKTVYIIFFESRIMVNMGRSCIFFAIFHGVVRSSSIIGRNDE